MSAQITKLWSSAQIALEDGPGNIVGSLADIFNLLPIGVQIDDPRHRTIYVNDSFTEMLGYRLDDIAQLDDWFRLAYPDAAQRARVRWEWAAHLAKAEADCDVIAPIKRVVTCRDGEQKVMEFHIRRIGGHYIYLNIDVSARFHLAAEQRRLANTDALTGVANRRHFFERGEAMMSGKPVDLATLIFDLDHFKAVNDGYGHAAGDEVLVEVANRCRAVLEDAHFLARLGGEEFGVLLPSCDEVAAMAVAERLRRAVADRPMMLAAAGLAVTIGAACGRAEDGALDALIQRADRALYAAKRAGRNTCRFTAGG